MSSVGDNNDCLTTHLPVGDRQVAGRVAWRGSREGRDNIQTERQDKRGRAILAKQTEQRREGQQRHKTQSSRQRMGGGKEGDLGSVFQQTSGGRTAETSVAFYES